MIADNDEGNGGSQPAPKKSRASKPKKESAVVISDVAEIPVETASSTPTAKESGGATVSKPKKAPTGKNNGITPDESNEEHEDEEDGEVLKMGDKLPSIKLNDEEGNTVDVSTLIGEKGVVFFLYPKVGPFLDKGQNVSFTDGIQGRYTRMYQPSMWLQRHARRNCSIRV